MTKVYFCSQGAVSFLWIDSSLFSEFLLYCFQKSFLFIMKYQYYFLLALAVFLIPVAAIAAYGVDPRITVVDQIKWTELEGESAGLIVSGGNFGDGMQEIGDLDDNGVRDLVIGESGDGDGGGGRGAVHIFFMDTDGTALSTAKISDTAGGFLAVLDNNDVFGSSIADLGDMDGDGVPDIAVSAPQDDDGGGGRGAVYILFLNADGTVKAEQKISDLEGSFDGVLGNNAAFGTSIATIGDVDDNGVVDLAVGSSTDADGGANSGAVWILFMDDDGTVLAEQKISSLSGGLVGLAAGTRFGQSVASIGDWNEDGVEDLFVGAVLDGTQGANGGSGWIVYLNDDGTVADQTELSGIDDIAAGALFGFDAEAMGDLNNDGTMEIAVGARGQDSVYLLSIDEDDQVVAQRRITTGQSGFGETIPAGSGFGDALTLLEDKDGNGLSELMVGAPFDDDGGVNFGAAWLVTLETNYLYISSDGNNGIVVYPEEVSFTHSVVGDVCADQVEVDFYFAAQNTNRVVLADNADFYEAEVYSMSNSSMVVSRDVAASDTFYAFFETGSGNRSAILSQSVVIDRSDCEGVDEEESVDEEEGSNDSEMGEELDLPPTGVSPTTGVVEMVSDVRIGDLIRGTSYDAVYYIDVNGTRRPFMNSQTYFTYFADFDDVEVVTNATLSVIPLGAPMLPKAGVVLIKLQSDPKVYAVAMHSTDMTKAVRRHVPSEQVAAELYGSDWADYVIDVDATMYSRFEEGAPMAFDSTVNRSVMKKRGELN